MAKEDITESLEAMVDKHGLLYVLVGLELVCSEKAEHISQNWQDKSLARVWNNAATVCGNAARHPCVADLP